jgi:hypothetical protein
MVVMMVLGRWQDSAEKVVGGWALNCQDSALSAASPCTGRLVARLTRFTSADRETHTLTV